MSALKYHINEYDQSMSVRFQSPTDTPSNRTKRKRTVLSLKQKLDIIHKLEKGEKANRLAKEYDIGTSSIADIRLKKESILKYVSSFGSEEAMTKRKTMKASVNKELDDAVYNWYQDLQKSGYSVSGQQICDKALELNKTFHGSPDFKASNGWLKNFKSRHGLDPSCCGKDIGLNSSGLIASNGIANSVDNGTPPPKRKRVVLSLKQKIDIIRKLEKGLSAAQLAREYKIGTSSVADIRMNQSKILSYVACFESMEVMDKRKTMKQAYNKELDQAVYNWYLEAQYSGQAPSGPAICEKALELNVNLGGSSEFKASNGWLQNFKSRHGLDFKSSENRQSEVFLYEMPKSPEDWTLKESPKDLDFLEDNSVFTPKPSDVNISEKSIPPAVDYDDLLGAFDSIIGWLKIENQSDQDILNLMNLRDLAFKKAMSVAFSSEDSEAIHRTVDVPISESRSESILFDDMYDILRCVEWINDNQFSKIALQFPDSLLNDAAAVALKLEDLTGKQIFILGDTSYGSCCVDEVAAEHVSADAIIHFGHACLSPTKRLPVLFIFGKYAIDICETVDSFRKFFPDRKSNVLILYETAFSYSIDSIFEQLKDYEKVILSELEIPGQDIKPFRNIADINFMKVSKHHRNFFIPESSTLNDYSVFYVGCRNITMANFMLALPNCTFYSYNPIKKIAKVETLDANKHLKKRYYYIEKAKDARIIGILVGTLGVSNYLTTINHLKELIRNSGRKSYTLVVGKLNSAKLANFSEIDVFVNVACIESSLIDSKDFYQPIITPFELEIALNQARSWTGDYILDFSEILPGAPNYTPHTSINIDCDVSLVTGKIRYTGISDENSVQESSETALVTRNNMEISSIHADGAGEILTQRSWKGLEQKLGETPSADILEGQKGIASRYEDEMTN